MMNEKEARKQVIEEVRLILIAMQSEIEVRSCFYDHEVYFKEGGLEVLEEALEQISKLNELNS